MIPLRRNVLIFHLGALGDFVMTWPLAMAAGRLLAQSRVMYVSHAAKGALAERVLRVESVDVENGWHQLFAESPELPERAVKLLQGAQLVFSFVASDDELWTRNVRQLSPRAQVTGLRTKAPDDAPPMHVTDFVLSQLADASPAMHAAMSQMLRSIRDRGVSGVRSSDGPIVIHPGSGAARKCWPIRRFIELAEAIRNDRGRDVKFVVGETELDQWPAERVEQLRGVGELVQPPTYVDLHRLIESSGTFIGNDTGPTHLAAITGTKTIALFGADPTRWSPIGPQVTVLRGDSIDAIEVKDVLAAIRSSEERKNPRA